MDNAQRLEFMAELEGYDSAHEMLEEAVADSVAPGICTREGCDYITQVEPDCRDGYCEACQENTVQSCLVLGGFC